MFNVLLPSIGHIENNALPIVASISVAAETCLPHSCLAMATYIRSIIPTFSHHVRVFYIYFP
jgi:hypothetical protein